MRTEQPNLSEYNRARVMRFLYDNGVASRAQIAKALDLTPAAITKITAKLIDDDLISETGEIEGARNRRSIGLTLDAARFHVIGVKFARSLIQVGLFDLGGNAAHIWVDMTADHPSIADAVAALKRLINDIIARFGDVIAIGMAVPGPYLKDCGRTAVVSSMQEWRDVNFPDTFADAFDVPVVIEQDARAGALAQQLFGADTQQTDAHSAQGAQNSAQQRDLAYYLIGEGVGLGVIEHGRTIDGARGTATEIGHVSIDVNGKACDCGNYGCLERYCSAVAIHETLDEALAEGDAIVEGSDELSHIEACEALFALAARGDERALALVRDIGMVVGYGLVTIINAFNPPRIIIGDIVAHGGETLLDAAQRVVDERVLDDLARTTHITLSDMPTDAAVTGAAAVAITAFLEQPSRFIDLIRRQTPSAST